MLQPVLHHASRPRRPVEVSPRSEFRFAGILLAFGVGCSGSPPPIANTTASPVAASCPSVIGGSVHDLDNKDAALAGATVAIGRSGDRTGERTILTDEAGAFVIEYLAQPTGGISVYFSDATAAGRLPACVDKLVWIGVHTHDASGTPSALVIRMEDRSLDVAAVQRASERREALAEKWLTFYEGFGNAIDGSHANCAQMAAALEQFVDTNRNAIDAIKHQQGAMSSRERDQLKDTVEGKFASRSAAVQQKIKGVKGCQSEPRVRRALQDMPK